MSSILLGNRYQVLQTLGGGGFGTTFLAEDLQMPSRRKCVIKQLKPIENNPEIYKLVQERFQREAATLESLGDANGQIPRLYAYFTEGELFYLIQEWIEGVTLTTKVQNEGVLPEATVQRIFMDILPVLDYVHQRQIIHRDIKPDNIILRKRDDKPVLIDFGAVRESMGTMVNSHGSTTSSIVIGTPGFMPSEQAAGRPLYSSDLYSLGLTMIYLLTGRFPSNIETDPRTGDIIWRQYAPQISPAFAAILEKTIQYNPRDRYATAPEVLQALCGSLGVPSPLGTVDPTVVPGTLPPPTYSSPTSVQDRNTATNVPGVVPPTVISGAGAPPPTIPQPFITTPQYDAMMVGRDKPMPPEIPGWNWGAFLLPGLWSVNNQVWLGLLSWAGCFLWLIGWFAGGFVLGAKGNEWAWKSRPWRSVEEFKRNQRHWAIAGFATWAAFIGLIVLLGVIGSQLPDETVTETSPTTEPIATPEPPTTSSPGIGSTPSTNTTLNSKNAVLTNLRMCTAPESVTYCDTDSSTFPSNVPSLLVSADMNDVPVGTEVTITWRYVSGDAGFGYEIDSITVAKDDETINQVWSRLPAPSSGVWDSGKYTVIFTSPGYQTAQKSFTIE
jgi:serine/threonine-protein kinase